MAIDIDIQDARIGSKELENGKVNIIDVAEARRFAFFSMVEPACPVYGDVG